MCLASHMFSVGAFIFKMLLTEIISYKGRLILEHFFDFEVGDRECLNL